jgi:hypothetical protein
MEGKCINWSSQEYINDPEGIKEISDLSDIIKDLEFYKSLFKTHHNSCLFNMRIKYLKGEKVWVDPTRDSREYISSLDVDSDTEEWLQPIKPER